MSYDLMVFEPDAVPTGHEEFLEWYSRQTKWSEDHGYDNPAISTPHLQAWYQDMVQMFPSINKPVSLDDRVGDEESSTDYAIGRDFIYASFAWSKSEAAYMTVARLAEKHRLGLFNASSTGEEVWVPGDGRMVLAHDKGPPTFAGRIKSFLNFD
ncbi:MAG: hypothetical protein JST28_08700 [Acidobacteria bacterium]|nr:hypothetical protein [Acidobacteriota bacterium]